MGASNGEPRSVSAGRDLFPASFESLDSRTEIKNHLASHKRSTSGIPTAELPPNTNLPLHWLVFQDHIRRQLPILLGIFIGFLSIEIVVTDHGLGVAHLDSHHTHFS